MLSKRRYSYENKVGDIFVVAKTNYMVTGINAKVGGYNVINMQTLYQTWMYLADRRNYICNISNPKLIKLVFGIVI